MSNQSFDFLKPKTETILVSLSYAADKTPYLTSFCDTGGSNFGFYDMFVWRSIEMRLWGDYGQIEKGLL
jgi:hypothetical protein